MTEQPNQRPDGSGPADSGPSYEPPSFVPPQGPGIPAPPLYGQDQYGQGAYGSGPYGQGQYGQSPQDQAPYGQPGQYSQPGPYAQYSQPGPYGQPAYYAQPQPRGLSIASMVCGIVAVVLGIIMVPQIAAIATGHLALRREPAGKAMSITGLVLGYLSLLGYGLFWVLVIVGLSVARSTYSY
ncbi:DUF4190 domain-containing protein [Pseudarthrobacter sp. J75]|uniref:DUF4190 domain-containing protein n=1 Tax=unclassified Pseudarthrobacter TaxID=2647000 RepID=UPI002E8119D7|nr:MULTISPECIES: DUF4190 domain-containing protein [unclassified Pseudarthrobacter]MEE2522031.1 DUF4190 domain-containing protein [Pseudarthrobacter sp. J47]MEE2528956.1 DUF4190 domain-containing protein [Pseudarthrobacter sp. J75]